MDEAVIRMSAAAATAAAAAAAAAADGPFCSGHQWKANRQIAWLCRLSADICLHHS